MNTPLEKAHKNLKIKAVTMRACFAELKDNMETFEMAKIEKETQLFNGVEKAKEMSYKSEGKEWWEYSFYYIVGVRQIEETDSEDSDNEKSNVLVEIRASFSALYVSKEKLDQETINAFSEDNVGYHVWPYWREFVQSTAARLNIPAPEIPFYICNNKANNDDTATEK